MSARENVTCPSCGSLVPVGDRKCDNCGARQKDFAPAPTSYTRPETAPVQAPVQRPSQPPALAKPSSTPAAPPHDYRPLAHRPPGAPAASPGTPAPYAVAPTLSAGTPQSVPPYAAGSHAKGVVPQGSPGAAPSTYAAKAAAVSGRSRAASLALVFALVPVAVNVVLFALFLVLLGGPWSRGDDSLIADGAAGLTAIGIASILGSLANFAFLILALLFGIVGLRQTAEGATGRWRAVLAIVIFAWHVLLVAGLVALAAG